MNTQLRRFSRRFGFSAIARLVLLLVLLSSSASFLPPTPALAADVAAEQTSVSGVMDAQAASYLDQLLSEINARRTRAGSPPVIYAGLDANLAVSQYLSDLTPLMVSAHSCFHGNGNPVSPGWDYVKGSGFRAEARGEVLACPGDNGYWTAAKIADGWWGSPSHWRSLYGDPRVNAIACGTFGAQNGGRAYQTIACVTYRV
ncbi:MAG: hypothetical protein IT306_29380 [Chloroflexi bacterium]|nr:hypothetical protein [Chloroflexota bacterium]